MAHSPEIREVVSKNDLKRFVLLPFSLYKGSPYWVPPIVIDELRTLRRDKNPAYDFCEAKFWLAVKNGTVVGRIAGIINKKYNEKWQKRYARFGWIDFIDDEEVSGSLFDTAEKWAKSRGLDAIHGPLGFCDMDHEGMLVEGFTELGTVATIYNYEYYPRHVEKFGYRKDVDWVEYEVKAPSTIPEKAFKVAQLLAERKRIRVLEAKRARDILPYATRIFQLINTTYDGFYGFVPLTEKQIQFYVKQYFPFIDPEYVKLLLDDRNEVAGFVIGMPSLSRALQKARGRLLPFGVFYIWKGLKYPKYIDLYLGAIRPDLQGKGADAFLMTELAKSCIKNRIVSAESNIELEDNVRVQNHWKYFESRRHKRRRCFIKYLD
jgi:ribosomal protein S18 acetylase RimI-like enzyme